MSVDWLKASVCIVDRVSITSVSAPQSTTSRGNGISSSRTVEAGDVRTIKANGSFSAEAASASPAAYVSIGPEGQGIANETNQRQGQDLYSYC